MLHQNRADIKGLKPKDFISDKQFSPKDFDLIIWGHMHEYKPMNNMNIYQPGSSVITKLHKEESKGKFIGVFKVEGKRIIDFSSFPLKNQRNFVYKEITIKDILKRDEGEHNIETLLERYIDEIINGIENKDRLPLIRVRVDYTGSEIPRVQKIERKFSIRVANEGYEKNIVIIF